jgi:hypothetical protein
MAHVGFAQQITGVETYYTNSFREWNILTSDEELRGSLRMRWIHQNDWTAWDVTLGDTFATIEQKWADQPDMWIIRCNGVSVTARTAWSGDFTRWKLNDGKSQLNYETVYDNQRDEWTTESGRKSAYFIMHTYWEGDPRQWVIDDQLPDEMSMAMRLALIFLTLHFSAPHI